MRWGQLISKRNAVGSYLAIPGPTAYPVPPPLCATPALALMAPHLTAAELDFVFLKQRAGRTPIEIHSMLQTYVSARMWTSTCESVACHVQA